MTERTYRIERYEDGPSFGLDLPRDRTFWMVSRWLGEFGPHRYQTQQNEQIARDIDNRDRWRLVAAFCETRAAAIEEAVR